MIHYPYPTIAFYLVFYPSSYHPKTYSMSRCHVPAFWAAGKELSRLTALFCAAIRWACLCVEGGTSVSVRVRRLPVDGGVAVTCLGMTPIMVLPYDSHRHPSLQLLSTRCTWASLPSSKCIKFPPPLSTLSILQPIPVNSRQIVSCSCALKPKTVIQQELAIWGGLGVDVPKPTSAAVPPCVRMGVVVSAVNCDSLAAA